MYYWSEKAEQAEFSGVKVLSWQRMLRHCSRLTSNGKRTPLGLFVGITVKSLWRDQSVQIRDTKATSPGLRAQPRKVSCPSFPEAPHCDGGKPFPLWVSSPGLWIKMLLSRDTHLECIWHISPVLHLAHGSCCPPESDQGSIYPICLSPRIDNTRCWRWSCRKPLWSGVIGYPT